MAYKAKRTDLVNFFKALGINGDRRQTEILMELEDIDNLIKLYKMMLNGLKVTPEKVSKYNTRYNRCTCNSAAYSFLSENFGYRVCKHLFYHWLIHNGLTTDINLKGQVLVDTLNSFLSHLSETQWGDTKDQMIERVNADIMKLDQLQVWSDEKD